MNIIVCKNLYMIWLHHALSALTKWCWLLWCCLQCAQRHTPWSTQTASPGWECSGWCWWSWRPLLLPSPTARASLFRGVHTSISAAQNCFWYKLYEEQRLSPSTSTNSWLQACYNFYNVGNTSKCKTVTECNSMLTGWTLQSSQCADTHPGWHPGPRGTASAPLCSSSPRSAPGRLSCTGLPASYWSADNRNVGTVQREEGERITKKGHNSVFKPACLCSGQKTK